MKKRNLEAGSMNKKEYVLETTQEKREEMKARGIDEDAIPAVGKHRFRRVSPDRVAKRHEQKIKITMFIDADVLDYFRARAEQQNAAPYQTQINAELRRVMEQDKTATADKQSAQIAEMRRALLNDEEFLQELKQKLAA